METGPGDYRDQIENWMESVCEEEFGESNTSLKHSGISIRQP
jgi:hypothetical protein